MQNYIEKQIAKLEKDSHFLILKLTTKLQQLRQSGTDIIMDIQINGIELSQEINTLIYSLLIYRVQLEDSSLFSKWSYNNGPSICKRMNLSLNLPPHVNINSKAIKYLSVRANTIKFLEGWDETMVSFHPVPETLWLTLKAFASQALKILVSASLLLLQFRAPDASLQMQLMG